MPIYEYSCEACGQEFQAIRRISDETLPPCAACGSERVTKKMSLSAFHLKGSGWYKTDYAKDKAGVNPKANSHGAAAGEAKAGEAKGGDTKAGEAKSKGPKAAESKAG